LKLLAFSVTPPRVVVLLYFVTPRPLVIHLESICDLVPTFFFFPRLFPLPPAPAAVSSPENLVYYLRFAFSSGINPFFFSPWQNSPYVKKLGSPPFRLSLLTLFFTRRPKILAHPASHFFLNPPPSFPFAHYWWAIVGVWATQRFFLFFPPFSLLWSRIVQDCGFFFFFWPLFLLVSWCLITGNSNRGLCESLLSKLVGPLTKRFPPLRLCNSVYE